MADPSVTATCVAGRTRRPPPLPSQEEEAVVNRVIRTGDTKLNEPRTVLVS